MRPRSPAPPHRAGGVPRQGRAGWVGTRPASPPRRASSGRCGRPVLPALLGGSCGVCASAPSGSPHRPQSHFPGLRTSFPWPSHLPDPLTSLRSSCSASSPPGPSLFLYSLLTFSPVSGPPPPSPPSHLLTCSASALPAPTGRGQRHPEPRCTPRMKCGPGRRGSVAGGVLPRPRTAPVSGAAGADQVFVSRWLLFCTPIR